MIYRNRSFFASLFSVLAFSAATALGLAAPLAHAQDAPRQPAAPARLFTIESTASSVKDAAETQTQLIMLLRLSPVLTSVVARDPSLLADQAYVARNNPELAQFIAAHPDVARNPEFYLFSNLNQGSGSRDKALERTVWPEIAQTQYVPSQTTHVIDKLAPIVIMPIFLLVLAWMIRALIESGRWNRAFRQQSEVHARLIDKFSTSQDLAAYMETEAGKSFLEIAPVGSASPHAAAHMPNAVARILTPLQTGIVLTLLGVGLLFLRHAGPDMETPMTVLGVLALTPGIGFILSAGVTWLLARRLGLLPQKSELQGSAAPALGPQ